MGIYPYHTGQPLRWHTFGKQARAGQKQRTTVAETNTHVYVLPNYTRKPFSGNLLSLESNAIIFSCTPLSLRQDSFS